jgi:C4-dicarboxylate-specific signal transduction histidine kinase
MENDREKQPGDTRIHKTRAELPSDQTAIKVFSRPSRLLVISLILIFWAEALVMMVMASLPPLTIITEAFIDAFLLTLILFPALYFLLLRPIELHMAERKEAENELLIHRRHLEDMVKERADELSNANERLQSEIEERKNAEKELQKRIEELESFYDISVGRELKLKELKDKVESLQSRIEKYNK